MMEIVTNFGALAKQMIKFINHDRKPNIPNRKHLKAFIDHLFRAEGRKAESITYIFCSDEYLLMVNRQFLQHDFYTDIITFDLGERGAPEVTAEIYISLDRVRENARTFDETLMRELLRVIFHGALHLCGYRDKTKREITLMREKESEYLLKFEADKPQ